MRFKLGLCVTQRSVSPAVSALTQETIPDSAPDSAPSPAPISTLSTHSLATIYTNTALTTGKYGIMCTKGPLNPS